MQPVQGTCCRLTIISFAVVALYIVHVLTIPSLPGFAEWRLRSLPTSSQRRPSGIAPGQTLDASIALSSILRPDNTSEYQDLQAARDSNSTSDPKDERSPPRAEGLHTSGQESMGERTKKEWPVPRGESPSPIGMQDEIADQNVGTAVDVGEGFRAEHAGGSMETKDRMSSQMKTESTIGVEEDEHAPPLSTANFEVGTVPWLPEVVAVLSKCGTPAPIRISEYFANNRCPMNCSGHGVCNHQLGECRCFHGYTGAGCELERPYECNLKHPRDVHGGYGPYLPSTCSGTCYKRSGFCFCGEDTKYPQRPVAEQCGFPQLGTEWKFDWTTKDPDVFGNNSTRRGWCNVDPDDLYAGRVQRKDECYCVYDGAWGELCEIPNQCSCINQCSGNGFCQGGFCVCADGWYGIDCSIPSSQVASLKTRPTWLSADIVDISNYSSTHGHLEPTEVILERYRPLIYVYDLPPEFNSLLMEGRHFKFHCVTRLYDVENTTIWTRQLYGAENAMLESLLASKHRTTNAEEADFFYVPVLGSCAISRAGEAPHMTLENYFGLRPYFAGDIYKKAYEHIKSNYPYWNQSDGRDHIWIFTWDEGACVSPKEIWSSMLLVHWGNTNTKHNYSTTCYPPDNWDNVPKDWRGNHPCYDPEKDLVLPSWKILHPHVLYLKLWERKIEERPTLFYFRGNLGLKYETGRPEPEYSMRIRQKIAEEFGTEKNVQGRRGRQPAPDVMVFNTPSEEYSFELASSRFCGVFPGDGWSGRVEDSIQHGCIPVIIQDGIHLPFENVFDYSQFSVRIAENDIPQMVDILRGIPKKQVEMMQATVQSLWQRFTYHSNILLEADRQKLLGKDAPWMIEGRKLTDDDAFDTFIQVLRYKLLQRTRKTATSLSKAGDLACHG